MKITSLQEYGMRCLLQLAEQGDGNSMRIRTIAENEGLSMDYVEKILIILRRAGLVRSIRGLRGGYALNRRPERISVGEAILALSGKPLKANRLKKDLCGQFTGNETRCVHLRKCNVRFIWSMVLIKVFGKLNKIFLSDLVGNELKVRKRIVKLMDGKGIGRRRAHAASWARKRGSGGKGMMKF